MAKSVAEIGKQARQRYGFWRSHRWLLWRRISQLTVLLLFLSGPWFGIWILKGNYSGSMLLETIPMTDPLMLLETLLTGYWPVWTVLLGGLLVTLFYGVVASRAFCAWVCPLNPVMDLAAWLRRRLGIRQSTNLPRTLRYGMLLVVLLGTAISGTLLWEWVNPVALLGRVLIFGTWGGLWLILALFLFDLWITEHGWCGHLCPMGALYGIIGARGVVRVSAQHRERCNRCMDCFQLCPEPQILREPLFNYQHSPQILSKDCISCGRCIDVCAEQVFEFRRRSHLLGNKE